MPKNASGIGFHYRRWRVSALSYGFPDFGKSPSIYKPVETFFSYRGKPILFFKGAIETIWTCSKLSGFEKGELPQALPNPCAVACDAEETPIHLQSKKCSLFWGKIKAESKRKFLEFSRSEKKEKRPLWFNHGILTRMICEWTRRKLRSSAVLQSLCPESQEDVLFWGNISQLSRLIKSKVLSQLKD